MNVSSEIFVEPEAAGQPIPALVTALEAGGVFYRVRALTRRARCARSWNCCACRTRSTVRFCCVYFWLARRSRRRPSAMGSRSRTCAIPWCCTWAGPSITLCFLEQPIEYDALDGKPVHTLFTIVSPTTRAHLHLMSRLSFVLRDSGVRRAIKAQESRQEILRQIGRAEERLVTSNAEKSAAGGGGASHSDSG